jgi:hypothetical protein
MNIRKSIHTNSGTSVSEPTGKWLDLGALAEVQVGSEDPEHPIEHALEPQAGGWRAAKLGPQTLRLVFDAPQSIRRIRVRFDEPELQRTHQFRLSWSPEAGSAPLNEIVRQQWNFSPQGAKQEVENYDVLLDRVKVLQLEIVPDISSPQTGTATLSEWRVG